MLTKITNFASATSFSLLTTAPVGWLNSSKSKLCHDWRLVSQSASVSIPSGAQNQIFITVRQMRVCWCGVPFLTGDGSVVCNCCWSSTAQSLSGPSPRRTHDHILLSQIRDSPNLEDQVPVFTPKTGWPSYIHPGTGSSFRRIVRLAGLRWRYSNPDPHGVRHLKYQSSLYSPGKDGTENISSIIACSLVAGKRVHRAVP
jgi:hypothetical protein